jgi:hypothetical protein
LGGEEALGERYLVKFYGRNYLRCIVIWDNSCLLLNLKNRLFKHRLDKLINLLHLIFSLRDNPLQNLNELQSRCPLLLQQLFKGFFPLLKIE